VTGATGFVGRTLCTTLSASGHTLVGLSRNVEAARHKVPALERVFSWEPTRERAPLEAFAGVDAVVHFAGENVAGRWNRAKKQKIYDSRVTGTKHLVASLMDAKPKPQTLICASAVGFYGDRGDHPLGEDEPPGEDFLAGVCSAWEAEAQRACQQDVRVVSLRMGLVLGPGGGALGAMLLPARLGLSGPLGSGQQWWSWVHLDDLIGLIEYVLHHPIAGPLNASSPNPVRQKTFAKALGHVLRRPTFVPTPSWVLKAVLGEFSAELLSSKNVLPYRAQAAGYTFKFPDLDAALRRSLT